MELLETHTFLRGLRDVCSGGWEREGRRIYSQVAIE